MQPANPFAYYRRAIAHDTAGEHDKAVSDISEALRLDPQYAIADNARAWMYFEAKKLTQALVDVRRSLDLSADDAASLDTRAHIYEALGRHEDAIAHVEIEIWPHMWHAWYMCLPVLPEAKAAITRIAEFVKDKLYGRRVRRQTNST